ncbi:hypothetical protein [Cohnella sp. GCM10012308]|uniref:hypothetical protein n=1 Tax=Cohnella sp. GCM10012308 TaxID=3317329 RepID=UPI003605F07C
METLQQHIEGIVARSRGGWYGLASWHLPELPADLAAEVNEWYGIRMINCLWLLRAADVPPGWYDYADVADKVVAVVRRKSTDEMAAEEAAARIR